MNIFISWSKDISGQYATIFRNWIPNVIQNAKPFISKQDISLGNRGIDEIENRLSYNFGILFVTSENMQEPWLLYEAGALSRKVSDVESRVVPVLIDLERAELVNSPLSHFQNAEKLSKETIINICSSINQLCDSPLPEDILNNAVEKNWPDFEMEVSKITLPSGERKKPTLESISSKLDVLVEEIVALRNSEQSQSSAIRAIEREMLRNEVTIGSKVFGGLADAMIGFTVPPLASSALLNAAQPQPIFDDRDVQIGRKGGHSDATE